MRSKGNSMEVYVHMIIGELQMYVRHTYKAEKLYEVCIEVIQPCNMKNRDIY